MSSLDKINAIEVNISCPNVKQGGMAFGTTCEGAAEVTREIRRVYGKTLIVKLSPNVTDIVSIAKAVEAEGADSVSLINTLLGMAIDVERQRPILSTITGGLSGPAVRPVAVRMVWQVAKAVNIPVLSSIPIIGQIFFQHNILVYLSYIMVIVTWFILEKTTFGLKIRAVGEHPRAADSKGIHVAGVRYAAVLIGGLYAGAAGAFMSTAYMNLFTESIISGRGFIAVSVVIFARFMPIKAMWGALLFGFASALQMRLQAMGIDLANQLLLMLPYVMTIVALIVASKKAEFPSAYTIPYSRMER